MITPYFGEFLVSPVPLEMSLNYCSHKCAYCFANLNVPDRRADIPAITNLIAQFEDRKTLAAQLLQQRYPVLLSNRVDPFAATNYKLAVPLIRLLVERGIPIAFQTKGGRGIDDTLSLVQPSSWYISISTLDDAIRKRIEPGAPTIASRLQLIRDLVKAGHHVTVGANPLVPEWLPDPAVLFREIHAAGASGVWIETLHLNRDQRDNMSDREREAITPDIIARAMKRRTDPAVFDYFVHALDAARATGLEVFCNNHPSASDYWHGHEYLYPERNFPTNQGFINWCHANKHPGEKIHFAEFFAYCAPRLPQLTGDITSYIRAGAARTIAKSHVLPKDMTWEGLLQIIWQDPRAKGHPAKNWALEGSYLPPNTPDGDPILELDDDLLPIAIFTGTPLRAGHQLRDPITFDTAGKVS